MVNDNQGPNWHGSGAKPRKGGHSTAKLRYNRSMLEFEILAHGLYRPDQLDISYDPSLTMPVTAAIQEWMDVMWREKLAEAKAQNFPLYDSRLFRLIHAEAQADGKLHLVIGNTSYKEYITTRMP